MKQAVVFGPLYCAETATSRECHFRPRTTSRRRHRFHSFGWPRPLREQGMLQVPNPTGYKGIAIAKRKEDEPKTDEPIVYAYARIIQKRRPVVASEVVLGLAEDKDRVTRCFAKRP